MLKKLVKKYMFLAFTEKNKGLFSFLSQNNKIKYITTKNRISRGFLLSTQKNKHAKI